METPARELEGGRRLQSATNQLTDANWDDYTQDEDYTYDANGNRTNTGYQTGPNNQLMSDGVYNYLYDNEGNRTSKTHIVSGVVTQYAWDHRNRLESIVTKDSGGNVIHQVDYTYDVFNRRIVKTIDADGAGPGTSTQDVYIYDGLRSERGSSGDHILLAFDENDALTNRYLHGPAVDQVLADEQVTSLATEGETLWTVTDHLGSIRHLVDYDPATEVTEVVNSLQYDSFGNITQETNQAIDHLFAFTGRERDEESDLQYNRARYFDAAVGRWISEDPIGFDAGDVNLSRYGGNASLDQSDPSGLTWQDLHAKWTGRNVNKAAGISINSSAVAGPGFTFDLQAMYFPDTGELGLYAILPALFDEREYPKPKNPKSLQGAISLAKAFFVGLPWGLDISLSVDGTVAKYIGAVGAQPSEWSGVAYGLSADFAMVGASIFETKNKDWVGYDYGSGVGFGGIRTDPEAAFLIGQFELPWCVQLALSYKMPPIPGKFPGYE